MFMVINMSKKVLTIQDISCYGSCSITVALPILSIYGIETVILPSSILSTHTGGFHNVVIHDLTNEMPKIIDHWISEGISFDAIYTGYVGDNRQFDYILKCKEKLLKPNGLLIVDPAMADHGKLYSALDESIIDGMKRIVSVADYIIPNITEAALLTNNEYREEYDDKYIVKLLNDLYNLGAKKIIISGIKNKASIGAAIYDGKKVEKILAEKQNKSYHGTGDIFSSVIVGNILNNQSLSDAIKDASDFVIKSIKATDNDINHTYGVKFEEVLNDRMNKGKQK